MASRLLDLLAGPAWSTGEFPLESSCNRTLSQVMNMSLSAPTSGPASPYRFGKTSNSKLVCSFSGKDGILQDKIPPFPMVNDNIV